MLSLMNKTQFSNDKLCKFCGVSFTPKAKNAEYCSSACRHESKKQTSREFHNNGGNAAKEKIPYYTPDFCFVDGEAIKHGTIKKPDGREIIASHYVMLQSDVSKPLLAPCIIDRSKPIKRLPTILIFEWFFQKCFAGKTICGYYLNYDFENWLVDVPDDLYKELLEAREVFWEGYIIWMIPKKIFRIALADLIDGKPHKKVMKNGESKYVVKQSKNKRPLERNIYDHSGYWQRSFIKTLESNKHLFSSEEMAIIESGKSQRNEFTIENCESIAEYNQLECVLGTKIVKDLFDKMADGFSKVDIDIIPRGKDAYSPKALSAKFFKLIKWKEKHPILKFQSETDRLAFEALSNGDEKNKKFPFSHAYAGGRIESFIAGRVENVYGYDINSAYPKGLAMMPEWKEDDLRFTQDANAINMLIENRVAGMYLIEYRFPVSWTCYPFFYRNRYGNVFFPDAGKSWVSSLELYAVLDTITEKELQLDITACLYIDNTETLGQVNYSENAPTESGKQWFVIYEARNKLKAIKNPGEHGAKLVYNAGYGATIQQVGVKNWEDESTLKFFNDFVGMWITAYCRATMWLAIAPHRKNKDAIVMIQTDGVYSTVPLSVPTPDRKILGMWEGEKLDWLENLMPGIYQYSKKGKVSQKQRGWGKAFDFQHASDVLHGKEASYTISQDAFIARGFAMHQHLSLDGLALQWVKTEKEFVPSLASKRVSPIKITLKTPYQYFKPKPNVEYARVFHDNGGMCMPFKLKFTNINHFESMENIDYLSEHIEGNEDYHAGIQE